MAASIRMDEHLLLRLKRYAQANDLSASNVVREALTLYLDDRQQSAFEAGADLFGRHRSSTEGASTLSVDRKARVRDRLHAKHKPDQRS